VVDQAYRGQGIGHRLIGKIVESVPKGSKLRLTSRSERNTQSFYEGLGFTPRETQVYEYAWSEES
jgi:ribosomal protein S18 acetylase RimI-like enzyme